MVTKNILVYTFDSLLELKTLTLIEEFCYTNTKIQEISKDADIYTAIFHSEISFQKMIDAAKEREINLQIQ